MYTCEDFPCCGHELNDCDGTKYGTDEAIKMAVYRKQNHPDYDAYYDEEQY